MDDEKKDKTQNCDNSLYLMNTWYKLIKNYQNEQINSRDNCSPNKKYYDKRQNNSYYSKIDNSCAKIYSTYEMMDWCILFFDG